MTEVHAVLDLQFGSTGKGALCGFLADMVEPDVVATSWGPNAGHTYVDANGNKFITRMLASSFVRPSVRVHLIGPGSVVDVEHLLNEVIFAGKHAEIHNKIIIMHPNATILKPHHVSFEKKLVGIGSTMKGTMAALVEKMGRNAYVTPIARDMLGGEVSKIRHVLYGAGVDFRINEDYYDAAIDEARCVLVEGAQGFGLGIHTQFWPHCTSRDISTNQLLADCRIPFIHGRGAMVWGTARTYPIRVANRYDDDGHLIGTSGPGYFDQHEMDWAELNREPELTTVTKLPRRIFSFSEAQIKEACRVVSPKYVALTFCDYIQPMPKHGEKIGTALEVRIKMINNTGAKVRVLTFGPSIKETMLVDDDGTCCWPTAASWKGLIT